MKKILSFALVLVLALSVLAGCGDKGPTVEDAVTYLENTYKTVQNAEDKADFDLVNSFDIDGKTFSVQWTADNAKISMKQSSKAGFVTVDIPTTNDTAFTYNLTATVSDEDGNTATYTLTRKVPVITASTGNGGNNDNNNQPEGGNNNNNTDSGNAPVVVGTAYKLYMNQVNLEKHLFATHNISNSKYYATVEDYTKAPDFFAEEVSGGYKFYTMINGAKMYVNAYLYEDGTNNDGSVHYSKRLNYANTTTNVWVYDSALDAWNVTLNGTKYVIGTYMSSSGSYDTFSISEAKYLDSTTKGVSQFPAKFLTASEAAALTPYGSVTINPITPTGSVTISLEDVANRTQYSTTSQVWEQNGIKVTNNKAGSQTNVAEYVPARFYKNSELKIEYTNIVKLVFTCKVYSDNDYASPLKYSISGADVTVDGDVVTVILPEATNCVTFASLAGQVRALTIEVFYTGEGGAVTPPAGDDNQGENSNPPAGDDDQGNTNTPGGGNTGTVVPSGSATISFADKANRTQFDGTIQVWEQNGIKVTNNKAKSSTAVGDYANPARFYQSSSLTIEAAGMVKIAFTCGTYSGKDYPAALVESIGDTANVTVDGLVVTVVLNSAADSFTIEEFAAQVRVASIEVFTA